MSWHIDTVNAQVQFNACNDVKIVMSFNTVKSGTQICDGVVTTYFTESIILFQVMKVRLKHSHQSTSRAAINSILMKALRFASQSVECGLSIQMSEPIKLMDFILLEIYWVF